MRLKIRWLAIILAAVLLLAGIISVLLINDVQFGGDGSNAVRYIMLKQKEALA